VKLLQCTDTVNVYSTETCIYEHHNILLCQQMLDDKICRKILVMIKQVVKWCFDHEKTCNIYYYN